MECRQKILIVDDDHLNVKLLNAQLPSQRYDTITACNGIEALQKATEELPDLILLDIMMPGMTGYEVTTKLKSRPETCDIPIVLITALDDTDSKLKGLEVGADEFLNKPVNAAELQARVKSILKLKLYRDYLKSLPTSGGLRVDTEAAAAAEPHILIVDDDSKDIDLLRKYSNQKTYHFSTAENGKKALSYIEHNPVDLVLLDVMMPGIDGFEVCRRIKKNRQTRTIQIIVITALRDFGSKIKGLELGADDFLVKPINRHELKARINTLIKKKKYIDELRRLHVCPKNGTTVCTEEQIQTEENA